MKLIPKLCLLFMVSLFLFACAKITPINRETISQNMGVELNTSIGEIFFEKEEVSGRNNSMNGDWIFKAQRIELSVRSATKEKLVLDYSEYYKKGSGKYGEITSRDPWLKRPAFDKVLEFDLTETHNIYIKKYAFEIIDIKGGRIIYKRIK